ncbi:MAG: nitroreductase family protein [Atopobiaceae bacterium]|nr:nitroreductase family protein [Atopobiaceae bacterium]
MHKRQSPNHSEYDELSTQNNRPVQKSIIDSLYARTSLRSFSDQPVTPEDERIILESACQAPTAGNQQLYSIVVVRDQSKKEALAESCDHQPFIAQAPLVLVFCADVRRWYRAFCLQEGCHPRKPGVGDALLACVDAVAAAQNAVVATEALGLGSCYIGDILENCETQRDILDIPEYVMPCCMLVIGHPRQLQPRKAKPPRFNLESIVFEDSYRDAADTELMEAIAFKLHGRTETLSAFCERKWNSDFSREMTRSVAQWLKGFPYSEQS